MLGVQQTHYADAPSTYALEQAFYDYVAGKMQAAGFAVVRDHEVGQLAVPREHWGGTCFTRNGLVACMDDTGWSVYAQGTELCLDQLPDEIGAVVRFVRMVEKIRIWPRVRKVEMELSVYLSALAEEAVRQEVRWKRSGVRRLESGSRVSARGPRFVPLRRDNGFVAPTTGPTLHSQGRYVLRVFRGAA